MPIALKEKHAQLKHEGIESVDFGKGYIVCTKNDKKCSLTFSAHTSLKETGLILHGSPRASMIFDFLGCADIGQGTATELIEAAKNGKIDTENASKVILAVEKGMVLFIPPIKKILVLDRIDQDEQFIDNQLFFTSTQREEAISEIVSHIKSCTKRLFRSPLKEKDLLSITSFISVQLP